MDPVNNQLSVEDRMAHMVKTLFEHGSVGFDPGDGSKPQDWTQALNLLQCHQGQDELR